MLNWPLIVEQLQLQPAENNKSPALGIKALSELKSPCSWGCCVRNVFFCGGGMAELLYEIHPRNIGCNSFQLYTSCMYLFMLKILIYFQVVESFNCYPVVRCFRGAPNIRSHYHTNSDHRNQWCRRYSQASSLRSGKHHAAPAPASFPLQIYWTVVFVVVASEPP